jgi:hypothetical protein
MDDALRNLRRYDVSAARAELLRARCHRALQGPRAPASTGRDAGTRRPRRAVRILAAAWCGVYLFETIRRAVSVYWS